MARPYLATVALNVQGQHEDNQYSYKIRTQEVQARDRSGT